jgi:adenine phosphoribosyltransferase
VVADADEHADFRSRIEAAIGHVPDFPFKGFPFRDVTPLLEDDATLFREVVDRLVAPFKSDPPDCVLCIESFGYVFGAPLAYLLGTRLVLARRGGKLPREVHEQTYDMVYARGKTLEIHQSAIRPGDRVLIVDDVLASGGSALAAMSLIEKADARCIAFACVAEAAILRDVPDRVELQKQGVPIVALATL